MQKKAEDEKRKRRSFSMTDPDYEVLEAAAQAEGRSVGSLVCHLVKASAVWQVAAERESKKGKAS